MIDTIHQWQRSFVEDGVFTQAKAVDNYVDELVGCEYDVIAKSVAIRQHTYSTGRLCARTALADIGIGPSEYESGLLRQEDGSVGWPTGAIGSISHTNDWAVAAVAKSGGNLISLGVDIEQIDRVDKDVLRLIATEQERAELEALADLRWGRVALFSIKESLYKCLRPLYGEFIRFKDVRISNLTVPMERGNLDDQVANSAESDMASNAVEVFCPAAHLLLPELLQCCDERRIEVRLAVLSTHVVSYVSYSN